MNLKFLKDNIDERGWYELQHPGEIDLVQLLDSVGTIISDEMGQKVQILTTKDKSTGIKASFSYKFGYSSFPPHTDTAFWNTPSRFVALTSPKESKVATFLFDYKDLLAKLSSKELLILKRAVFTLKLPSGQKFISLFFKKGEHGGFRYDPNIMIPYNCDSRTAAEMIATFTNTIDPTRIQWMGTNILFIDNWRMLHGREDSSNDIGRTLHRVYLKNFLI